MVAATRLVTVFMASYRLMSILVESPSSVLLRDKIWERAMQGPLSLVAAVELLRACYPSPSPMPPEVVVIISGTLSLHMVALERDGEMGQRIGGWTKLLGSDSMQRDALESLQQLHSYSKDISIHMTSSECGLPFIQFLSEAASAGKMSQAVLEAMLTNEGLLAHLRDGACGGLHGAVLTGTVEALTAALANIHKATIIPKGRPEAHRAMQSAVLGAVRQSTVLLQLRTVAPALRQRAVRRAQREGFLMVRRSPILMLFRAPSLLVHSINLYI